MDLFLSNKTDATHTNMCVPAHTHTHLTGEICLPWNVRPNSNFIPVLAFWKASWTPEHKDADDNFMSVAALKKVKSIYAFGLIRQVIYADS